MLTVLTTSHSVLLADTDARAVFTIHQGRGLYYGIDLIDEGMVVACRDQRGGKSRDHGGGARQGVLLVFDRSWRLIRELAPPDFPLRDVHGLLAWDGRLWVTSTWDNMVAVYDRAEERWTRWYPSDNPDARGRDQNHFNTLAILNSTLYLVAHNQGPSEIWGFCYPELRRTETIRLGTCAHNVWRAGDELLVCSSGRGTIEGTRGTSIPVGRFPRGIATQDGETLLGLSEPAPANDRPASTAVARLFRNDWEPVIDLILPGEGMLLDIRCIPADRFDALRDRPYRGSSWEPTGDTNGSSGWGASAHASSSRSSRV